jgi:hypothetical protein
MRENETKENLSLHTARLIHGFRNTLAAAAAACLLLLVAAAPPATAGDAHWLETNAWSGNTPFTTPMFTVNTDTWRLLYRINSRVPATITVRNAALEKVAEASNQEGPLPGRLDLRAPRGRYFLEITGTSNREWHVAVQQRLSTIAEWQLLEERRTPATPLRKLAVWHGGPGRDAFTLPVPADHWKVRVTAVADGHLEVAAAPAAAAESVIWKFALDKAGSAESWIHRPAGTFTVSIDSQATAWKVEVLY